MAGQPGGVLRWLLRAPRVLYRWHAGWLLGHRFLLLRHTGRRSGAAYQTVLEVVHYDAASRTATCMSGWGAGADWYRNVMAGPAAVTRADFEDLVGMRLGSTSRFLAIAGVLAPQNPPRCPN